MRERLPRPHASSALISDTDRGRAFIVAGGVFPGLHPGTARSVACHIGNRWCGRFLPLTAFAMVAATGDVFKALW